MQNSFFSLRSVKLVKVAYSVRIPRNIPLWMTIEPWRQETITEAHIKLNGIAVDLPEIYNRDGHPANLQQTRVMWFELYRT